MALLPMSELILLLYSWKAYAIEQFGHLLLLVKFYNIM